MEKLIGKFKQSDELSDSLDNPTPGYAILQNFNTVVSIVHKSYDVNTGETTITLNAPVLSTDVAPMYFLGNDNNLKLSVTAINQTQFVIKPTELDGSMVNYCEWSYFEIPVFL